MTTDPEKLNRFRRIGLVCGIVCLLAGLVITVLSAFVEPDGLRLTSGVLFMVIGLIYILINTLLKRPRQQ